MKELKIIVEYLEAEQIVSALLDATSDFENAIFFATLFTAMEARFHYKYDFRPDFADFIKSLPDRGIKPEGKM